MSLKLIASLVCAVLAFGVPLDAAARTLAGRSPAVPARLHGDMRIPGPRVSPLTPRGLAPAAKAVWDHPGTPGAAAAPAAAIALPVSVDAPAAASAQASALGFSLDAVAPSDLAGASAALSGTYEGTALRAAALAPAAASKKPAKKVALRRAVNKTRAKLSRVAGVRAVELGRGAVIVRFSSRQAFESALVGGLPQTVDGVPVSYDVPNSRVTGGLDRSRFAQGGSSRNGGMVAPASSVQARLAKAGAAAVVAFGVAYLSPMIGWIGATALFLWREWDQRREPAGEAALFGGAALGALAAAVALGTGVATFPVPAITVAMLSFVAAGRWIVSRGTRGSNGGRISEPLGLLVSAFPAIFGAVFGAAVVAVAANLGAVAAFLGWPVLAALVGAAVLVNTAVVQLGLDASSSPENVIGAWKYAGWIAAIAAFLVLPAAGSSAALLIAAAAAFGWPVVAILTLMAGVRVLGFFTR